MIYFSLFHFTAITIIVKRHRKILPVHRLHFVNGFALFGLVIAATYDWVFMELGVWDWVFGIKCIGVKKPRC